MRHLVWTGAGLALAAIGLAACAPPEVSKAPDPADIAAARQAAGALGRTLKGELQAAMRDGGAVAAIEVCNERAPAIAHAVSADSGLTVGRTALKLRNQENAPDAWEAAQLRAFMEAVAAGADPAALEVATIIETDGEATFRWMKPIILDEPCAACHGTDIAPPVRTAIQALYPADEATGFVPGEVRGAFTVSGPAN